MSETIGFTGTRALNPMGDIPVLMAILEALPPDCTVITGACIGVDSFIASQAHGMGLKVHTVVPADRSRVDLFWPDHCTSFEEMPAGTDYRARNQRIVDLSDRIIAIPDHMEKAPESRRSGTWMTVRLARKAGKLVDVHLLCRSCQDLQAEAEAARGELPQGDGEGEVMEEQPTCKFSGCTNKAAGKHAVCLDHLIWMED